MHIEELASNLTAAVAALGISTFVVADDRTISEFTELSIANGISAHVMCDDVPRLTSPDDLTDLEIVEKNGELTLINHSEWLWGDHKPVKLVIYTNQHIEDVTAVNGTKLTLSECAVSPDAMRVRGQMGTLLHVAGETEQLDLEIGMGAAFNDDDVILKAQQVNLRAAMGAYANLCHAEQIHGSLSAGAKLDHGRHTDLEVNADFGTATSSRDCL
ncbi:hypothetical protein [Thaumasiovibrio subtropicus]|uniref:hypothetical protein n=1 Tax=Thaumasiovibrio subtropicus TaxID=1891207 RepID=UPI000B34AD30|nr:hypothetical protein [Thaumasiovibrio subtropicus]